MVPSSNAWIEPGTVVIVPFNTAIASVAVVAPRDGDNLTVKAQLVDGKSIQKLRLSHCGLFVDVSWTTAER